MESASSRLQTSFQIKVFLLLLTIALIVLMFPKGESLESNVTVGSIWIQQDLIASKSYEVLKEKETYDAELNQAANSVFQVFIKDESLAENSKDSLEQYNTYLLNLLDQVILSELDNYPNPTILSNNVFERFLTVRRSESRFSSRSNISMSSVFNVSRRMINLIYQRGFLSLRFDQIEKDTISVRTGKYERAYLKYEFIDETSLNEFLNVFLKNNLSTDDTLIPAVSEYIKNFLLPNIIYSSSETEAAIRLAQNKVSRNVGIVNENERIVAKHDRITPEIKLKIDSYRIAKGEDTGFWEKFTQGLGKFLHIVIALSLFIIYLYLFRKKIFYDNFKLVIIIILILMLSFVTFIVRQITSPLPLQYLIFIPIVPMLLTILFDSRIGFYGTVIVSIIAGGLQGNDYVFTVTNIFAGALAAYTVRDIKNRSQIFRSFTYILIGYLVSIIAFGLERFSDVDELLISAGFAVVNALISPVLTYGLIIFFEKSFKITTELTLLELTDFNLPLLRELARNAPGTFNHSMTIGSLVENAAEVINANPLLARVGAYYHDIGKLNNPNGFVENQMNNTNIHEELKPEKSKELIVEHVKKGIDLAREYGLPDDIVKFIPMHHGTMVVSFFYEKAKELYGADKVKVNDYRYPGPKPNTRETTLVMLADACESAVRAMTEADPKKVENIINNIFKARAEDGQLDESPLTFGDLAKVKDAFLNILIGQHHKRIRYPKQDEMEQNPDNN